MTHTGIILIELGKHGFRNMLWWRQQGKCFYCQEPMNLEMKNNGQPSRLYATFEHLKRREDGGTMSDENIVLAHYRCNIKKNREYQKELQNGKRLESQNS